MATVYKDTFNGYSYGSPRIYDYDDLVYSEYSFDVITGQYKLSAQKTAQEIFRAGGSKVFYVDNYPLAGILQCMITSTSVGATYRVIYGARYAVETESEWNIVSGYGDENVIDKDNVAIVRDFIFGDEYGVINGFNASIESGTQGSNAVKLEKGQLYAYGYVAELPESVTFNYLLPSVEQYWFIYGEIDMSRVPNRFTVKTKNNGRSQNATWRQDVLSSIRTGVFQLPLYCVKLTADGAQELESLIKNKDCITNVYNADIAEICIGNIESNVTAVTQETRDSSKKVATTEFVKNVMARENNTSTIQISYTNIRATATNSEQEGWISRRFNSCIGRIYLNGYAMLDGMNGRPIASLPIGYRPKENIVCKYAGYSLGTSQRGAISVTIRSDGEILTTGTTLGFNIMLNFGYKI